MSKFLEEFPEIKTERLVLRKVKEDDAKDLYNYYSNPNVTRYLDWNGPESVEDTINIIRSWNNEFKKKNFIRWAITLKGINLIIGTVVICTKDRSTDYGLFTHKITDSISIGYELSEDYWNRGIMSEAVKAVISFAFAEIGTHRIQAYVEPDNKASLHILKKMHFQVEGLLRSYLFDNGTSQFDDVIMLSLLVDDYSGLA